MNPSTECVLTPDTIKPKGISPNSLFPLLLLNEVFLHMITPAPKLQDLDQLRSFVNGTLCENGQLEVGEFAMTERLLTRSSDPCGMYFCVHGPRSVKLTAIWETDNNRVLFYDCAGERFLESPVGNQNRLTEDLCNEQTRVVNAN